MLFPLLRLALTKWCPVLPLAANLPHFRRVFSSQVDQGGDVLPFSTSYYLPTVRNSTTSGVYSQVGCRAANLRGSVDTSSPWIRSVGNFRLLSSLSFTLRDVVVVVVFVIVVLTFFFCCWGFTFSLLVQVSLLFSIVTSWCWFRMFDTFLLPYHRFCFLRYGFLSPCPPLFV